MELSPELEAFIEERTAQAVAQAIQQLLGASSGANGSGGARLVRITDLMAPEQASEAEGG